MAILLGFSSWSVAGAQTRSRSLVVEQQNAPVAIDSYSAWYSEVPIRGSTLAGIYYVVEFSNKSGRRITAIEFGLVSFDVFNEFLDWAHGLTVFADRGLSEDARYQQTQWVSPSANGIAQFTGVAWVNRVRFESGEIWVADRQPVLERLRQIQPTFDASILERKPRRDDPAR
jgi:hypothetical protein